MAKKVDINGFWIIEGNPITKEGVFPYSGAQIDFDGSLGLEKDKLYNVYRPAAELQKAETIESFNASPFIDDHEMIGEGCTDYDKRPAGGILFNVAPDGSTLKGDFKIFSEKLRDAIQRGKKELSLGYRCCYEAVKGVFDGACYDFMQTNIVGNHVALVDKGRMGSSVRVYDSKAMVFDSIEEIKPMKKTLKERLIAAMDGEEFSDAEKKEVLDAVEPDESEAKTEDEGEEEKEEATDSEAEDADEDEEKKSEAEDEEEKEEDCAAKDEEEKEENKSDAMDAFPAFAALMDKRNSLVKKVAPLIGTFDHAAMTPADVATYACKKLKISANKGEELATLNGYLAGKGSVKKSVALDAAVFPKKDSGIEKYLKGE